MAQRITECKLSRSSAQSFTSDFSGQTSTWQPAIAERSGDGTSDVYPPIANTRYASLDIWRGLACLMVVVEHAAIWARYDDTAQEHLRHPLASAIFGMFHRLDIGVPMFFVISGYCIAATADSSRRHARGITANYFKRRLRRIFPPYWVVIGLTLLVGLLIQHAGRPDLLAMRGPDVQELPQRAPLTAMQWFGSLTLTETWRHHLVGPSGRLFIEPAWTLCYEEQFYIVCGLLLLAAPRRFFLGATLITLATVPLFIALVLYPKMDVNGFWFDGQWLTFGAGVVVYYQLNYVPPKRRGLVTTGLCVSLIAFTYLRYGAFRDQDIVVKNQFFTLFAANAFALIILWLRPIDARLSKMKVLEPIGFCGRMCYSLYLIHWPVALVLGHILFLDGIRGIPGVLLVTVPLVTGISIGLSWFFHQLVERHFLNAPIPASDPMPAF